jgi:hypothetical protein
VTLMGQPSSDVGTPIHDQLALEMWPDWEAPDDDVVEQTIPPAAASTSSDMHIP